MIFRQDQEQDSGLRIRNSTLSLSLHEKVGKIPRKKSWTRTNQPKSQPLNLPTMPFLAIRLPPRIDFYPHTGISRPSKAANRILERLKIHQLCLLLISTIATMTTSALTSSGSRFYFRSHPPAMIVKRLRLHRKLTFRVSAIVSIDDSTFLENELAHYSIVKKFQKIFKIILGNGVLVEG